MFPCHFPSGTSLLQQKDSEFDIKSLSNSFAFDLLGVKFKSHDDMDKSKIRITMKH